MFFAKKIRGVLLILLLMVGFFGILHLANATSGNINVQMSVPSSVVCGNGVVDVGEQCDDGNVISGDGCSATCTTEGGGGGEGDNLPSIFNVVSTPGQTTANVAWNASDDKGIQGSSFVYGLTLAYGSNGVVAGAYSVALNGLQANTTYYYKISVTDTGNQTVTYLSSFKTTAPIVDLQPPVISNVQVVPGITSAVVSWNTDEGADSLVNYGLTAQYGKNVSDIA
ncbi:MAG: DUF4215 domain-containing protein, partial [bacterium]